MSVIAARILCYRLTSRSPYDEDEIWSMVLRYQGWMSIRQDCIDFYLAREYACMLVLAFPLLEPRPEQNYV